MTYSNVTKYIKHTHTQPSIMCISIDNSATLSSDGQPPVSDTTGGIHNDTTYHPPSIGCHYSQVPIDIPRDLIGHFIGIDGRVFKAIHKRFKRQGCLYIWFNNDEHFVEVYSKSHETALDVRQALLERQDKISFAFRHGW